MMEWRTRLVAMAVLATYCAGCKAGPDEPCYKDEMCDDGLVCHERYCEPAKKVRVALESEKYAQAAVEGFRELVHKCQALFDTYAAIDRWSEEMGEMFQEQLGLKPGDEVDVEAEIDEELASQLSMLSESSQNAFLESMRLAVPLRDENPVFRKAVREALREFGKPGEPGPASSVEIDFCDPDLLPLIWKHLGEPTIEGVTD